MIDFNHLFSALLFALVAGALMYCVLACLLSEARR